MFVLLLTIAAVGQVEPARLELRVQRAIETYQPVEMPVGNELGGARVAIDPILTPARNGQAAATDYSLLTATYLYHLVIEAGGTPVLTRTRAEATGLTHTSGKAALVFDTGCSVCISIRYDETQVDFPGQVPVPASDDIAAQMRSALGTKYPAVAEPQWGAGLSAGSAVGPMVGCEVRFNSAHLPPDRVGGLRRCLQDAARLFDGLVAYYHHTGRPLPGAMASHQDHISPVPDMPVGPMELRLARMGQALWPDGPLPAERLEWFCRTWTKLAIRNHSLVCFEVKPYLQEGVVVLIGSANSTRPALGLEHALRAVGMTQVRREIRALPDQKKLGEQLFGVCRVGSVLTLNRPSPRGGMQSQLLLGEPVFLLDEKQGYLRVHGGDGYWGWVPAEAIERMDGRRFDDYRAHRTGVLLDDVRRPGWTLPRGAQVPVLGIEGDRRVVLLPDGSTLDLPAKFMTVDDTSGGRAQARVRAALDMLYAPYLFGGRSPSGLDCSGLITNAWAQAGLACARDAWQQALAGTLVATAWHRSGIRAGDQVFFINDAGRIHHTGLALDATHVIHASPPCVQIASLVKGDRLYDTRLDRDFFMAKRP
ncbi:MAG: NlpC/P60 family protein [Phycisphaerae bacterium]